MHTKTAIILAAIALAAFGVYAATKSTFAPSASRAVGTGVGDIAPDFTYVTLEGKDEKDFIQAFKKNNATPWDYADARGGADISRAFGLDRFEITYILDKDGTIAFRNRVITSSQTLDEELQKLL